MRQLCRNTAALFIGIALAIASWPATAGTGHEAVRMTFLGNMAFRFETPDGVTLFMDPWLEGNPDSTLDVADVQSADLILVSGAHGDNVGDTVALAKRTGATVIATAELASWLGSQGVPSKQLHAMMPGGYYRDNGLAVKMLQAVHTAGFWPEGEATPEYGGMSVGFLVGFKTGLRVYFSGDTALFGDMRLFGEIYRPHVAILSTRGRYMMEPPDGARAAELLASGNSELTTVVPAHHLVKGRDREAARSPARVAEEVEELGLSVEVLQAKPGKAYGLRP